ncbi:MAG: hypothetical protein ABL899_02260 [Nitrospira sp.]
MTEERRKELALLVLEKMVVERGIPAGDALRRDVGNLAKKLQVTTEELMELYQSFVPKMLGLTFGFGKVDLIMSDPRKRFDIQE